MTSLVILDNTIAPIVKMVDAIKAHFEDVKVLTSEEEALDVLGEATVDLILVNLNLKPNDAISFTRGLKQERAVNLPFIVVYAKKPEDFVQELAYDSGADAVIDFYDKPGILVPFLKNLLSRRQKIKEKSNKQIELDEESYVIHNGNKTISLPRKEFRLFKLLYLSPGKFFTKKEIALLIWNDESIAMKRTIDVHVYNIRKAFKNPIIRTQKNKGYSINKSLIEKVAG